MCMSSNPRLSSHPTLSNLQLHQPRTNEPTKHASSSNRRINEDGANTFNKQTNKICNVKSRDRKSFTKRFCAENFCKSMPVNTRHQHRQSKSKRNHGSNSGGAQASLVQVPTSFVPASRVNCYSIFALTCASPRLRAQKQPNRTKNNQRTYCDGTTGEGTTQHYLPVRVASVNALICFTGAEIFAGKRDATQALACRRPEDTQTHNIGKEHAHAHAHTTTHTCAQVA